jgi:hypothetical protein
MEENEVFSDDPLKYTEALLERGFYPENVPPVFQVTNFFGVAQGYIPNADYLSRNPTEAVSYSASKRGGARRMFSVPNPIFFVDCAIFFSQFRAEVFEHFESTNDSLSVPIFSETERPATINSHSDFHRRRRSLFAASRYIVKTDISRYFHSIYTHSIPWGLNGKAEAKKDRKFDSVAVYGNRLDYILRTSQDGQTIGIPVGPDFSRYISEIIGKAIDKKFRELRGDAAHYLRHVDDIYIGADDQDQAADFLAGMREAIRSMQLDINEAKTVILESRYDLEPYWPVRIRREIEKFHANAVDPKKVQTLSDLAFFLDEVFRVANNEGDDGVVKFTIKKFDEAQLWEVYWNSLEPFLVRAAVSFPRCWDYVARVVAWRAAQKGSLSKAVWQNVMFKALLRSAMQGDDSEVCWILWLAKQLEFPIPESALRAVIQRCGAMSALLAIDLFQTVSTGYNFPNAILLDRIGNVPMNGPDWLLAYEADRQFGFKIKTKNVNGSPLFAKLYDSNVSFYSRDARPHFVEGEDGNLAASALEGIFSGYDDDEDDDDNTESSNSDWDDPFKELEELLQAEVKQRDAKILDF